MMNKDDILKAQKSWGDAVVTVGRADRWEQAHALATQLVNDHYLMDGSLLFCPTKAAVKQFRPDLEAAVSYFVGNNIKFHEDRGFALEPWTAVRFENTGIQLMGDTAIAMGNYFFRSVGGHELKVEFTFAYRTIAGLGIRIAAHHSAIPYGSAAQ